MKYPQLVSTRAVNAISDWLVSRLEQIGVEAPLIYSRLLLSLLHSSVQINDPIEFNNLETYLANRKGSKRVPPCDTETLKKITAVQCLVDAVSTEQEISKIENLVDELFEKLNDLEKQTNEEDLHHQLPTSLTSLDIEDPRKRYYRAFPALSKEMEDSVWLSKRNVKSLTWPTGNSGTSSSSMVALSNTAGVKRKTKRRRNQALSKGRVNSVRKNSCGENCSPTWDTDFEGNWEMGQDLIKEFLMSQKNRNRSISESDACNLRYEENFNRMKPMQCDTVENYEILSADEEIKMDIIKDEKFNLRAVVRATKVNKPAEEEDLIDVNLMHDGDNEHDGYSAYDELTSPKEVDRTSNMARRLYQRDDISNNNSGLGSLLSKQQNDFVQFEAKFNSSVEALWKTNTNDNDPSKLMLSGGNTIAADNDVMNPTNVDNFWTSYYNHHYNDTDTDDQRPQQFCNSNITKTNNDFFSMPANFGKLTDSSDMHKKKMSAVGENLTSGGVFLRDSIWSDNSLSAQRTYDEDDSFYGNCWGSAIKLEGRNDIGDVKDLPNPFSISKWSECSFETPFIPSSASNEAVSNKTAAGLAAAKHDIRDNFLKNSYLCSSYKQTVAPGTNKTSSSLQQQSPQPISLPDFYGSLRLNEKDYNKSPSAASAVPVMPPQQPSPLPTVSLTNHSKTSGFIQYSIVKSSMKIEPIAKIDRNNSRTMLGPPGLGTTSSSTSSSASQPEEEENLLTSYRTHFRPIKQSYADGHQFDISGSLDEVDFDRSETGCLYLDAEKYFEYTRDDMFLSDEEPAVICSFSEERGRDGRANVIKGLHPLKFRVKQIDKQCQTEDLVATASSIAAVVDAIVLTPKKPNITTSYDSDEVANSKDEVDFAGPDSDCYLNDETSIDLDQWSMAEIGKKCADNNNSHTLWGMCPACNKVNKCVPANRLLKDELIVEADEIMSDLKYMQDLYICSDWEDEDDDGNDTDDSELDALKHDDDSEVFPNEESSSADDDEEQEQIFYNITKLISDLLKPENAKSLVDVLGGANQGKNIFRGMYPEDEIPVSNVALHEHQKNVIWKNVNNNNNNNNNNNINHNNNNEKYIGGLWSNDENIIWKRELKPWGGNIDTRIHDNKGSTFLDKLNWKHGNLAEIWNSGAGGGGGGGATEIADDSLSMPSSQSTDTKPLLQNHHIDPKLCLNNRNMKNLLSWNISQHYIDNELIAAPQRNHCYLQRISNAAATIVNRADRKRRHSASQNISCSGNCGIGGGNNHHQCDASSGGNEWHGNNGMMAIGNKIEIMAKRELDYSKLSLIDDTSPATIITCKYWTTMDTTLASPYFMDKNSHYDGIGTMAMNPSSILKHVTVVSRPLTR